MRLGAHGGTAVLLVALTSSACGYGSDEPSDPAVSEACGTLVETTIDADAEPFEVDPGVGAGAFVEYAAGGNWHLFTSCDTLSSGYACDWDVIVSVLERGALHSSTPEDLESDDLLYRQSNDSLRLLAFTDTAFDGFTFQADAGVGVRVDALLDGVCANRYLYWFGGGARHDGSPSNPLDLIPSAP